MADKINRPKDKSALATFMMSFPVTAILGPRQSGKTTLAHEFPADHFFDLENPRDAVMLAEVCPVMGSPATSRAA